MLAEAGLSPLEILRAATVNPAKMLSLADRIGTVEVGISRTASPGAKIH